ncbi:MAG: hypothetical protein U1E11_03850, partial [Dethiobacteria bacterium]|nr:hypothetical protein [Dethiobacteria bacterium]
FNRWIKLLASRENLEQRNMILPHHDKRLQTNQVFHGGSYLIQNVILVFLVILHVALVKASCLYFPWLKTPLH